MGCLFYNEKGESIHLNRNIFLGSPEIAVINPKPTLPYINAHNLSSADI
jgi:hypothetical protein